jgi:NTE family protein
MFLLFATGFQSAPATMLEGVDSASRPKIGLALSGGGARGAAHLGVIRVLEENNIPIDYIAGTSMGSIVGGMYAAGMSVDEIEEELASIDWGEMFDDLPPRGDRSFRRKRDDELYRARFKPGFNDGKLDLPRGVIQGQNIDLEFTRLILPVASIEKFEDLTIPFRAVTADITTGEEVALSSGNLAIAIRASMSIPAVFTPVEVEGRPAVDAAVPRGKSRSRTGDLAALTDGAFIRISLFVRASITEERRGGKNESKEDDPVDTGFVVRAVDNSRTHGRCGSGDLGVHQQ